MLSQKSGYCKDCKEKREDDAIRVDDDETFCDQKADDLVV